MSKLYLLFIAIPLVVFGQTDTNSNANQEVIPNLLDAQKLANLITATQATLEQIAAGVVTEWDDIALACEQARGKLFGNMSADCRKIRAAIRQGDLAQPIRNCLGTWASTMNTISKGSISSEELERNKESITRMLTGYNQARQDFCFFTKFSESNPALFSFIEEAINSDPDSARSFSNVDLTTQILDGQRTLMDQNFEQERLRNENLLNQ